MHDILYQEIIMQSSMGYATHQILCDEKGIPYDYRFSEVNSTFESLMGLDKTKLVGKTILELYSETVNNTFDWIAFYQPLITDPKPQISMFYSTFLKIWYEIKAYSTKENCIITLLTEKSSDEILLKKAFLNMVDDSPLGVLFISHEKKIIFSNSKAAEILGAPSSSSLLEEEHLETFIQEIVTKESPCQVDYNFTSPWGKKLYLKIHINTHTDKGLSHFYVVLEDITNEHQVQTELRKQHAMLKTIIEMLPGTLTVIDPEYRIIHVNNPQPKWVLSPRIASYTNNKCYELYRGGSEPCERCRIPEVIETKKSIIENTVLGDPRELQNDHALQLYLSPIINDEGDLEGVVEYAMDITELRNAKLKAEQLSQAKSLFLANISHDLRTPMNALQGYTQLLEDTYLNAQQVEYINQLKTSSNLIMNTINGILDISKFESGKMTLNPSSFNLNNALKQAAEPFALLSQKKGLIFKLRIDNSTDIMVKSDLLKLKSIVNNLVSNAVKFTTTGSIRVDAMCYKSDDTKLSLSLRVKDTSIGIAESYLDEIFEPFVQGNLSIDMKNLGTGLGLTLVKKVVTLFEGEISLKSSEETGTDFHITLPLIRASSAFKYQKFKGLRFLYINDSNKPNNKIQSALEKMDCHINQITKRSDAINLLLNSDYDLCILTGDRRGDDSSYLSMLRTAAETRNIPLLISKSLMHGYNHLFEETVPMLVLENDFTDSDFMELCCKLIKDHKDDYLNDINDFLHAKILTVDDSEISRALLTKILELNNLSCDIATTDEEALKACEKTSYDIILMDCELPGINGFEATRQIRQMRTLRKQPIIIAMTAHAMVGDDIRCTDAGMDDYMSKPVDRNALIKRIQKWMSSDNQDFFLLQVENFSDASGLDWDFCEELVRDYIISAEETVATIQTSLMENKLKVAGDLLHQLKGSSGNIRAYSIAYYAQKAEDSIGQHNTHETMSYLSKISGFVSRMKEVS